MSSNLSKIRSIIQHFKIKYDIKLDLKNQPYVLDQLARILNIKLEKLSFEKKLSKILKAFNEYSKKRQLFDQSESINKPRERTGEKTGVPEAQKFIIPPHAFQSNRSGDQLSLFADKQIESLKDLITDTQLELSTDIKSSRTPEVAKFAKKFDTLELKARNQAKEELSENDYERFREAKSDDDVHLPNNFEDLSPIVQGWVKWTREDIDDYEFFDSIDEENDATLPSAFESKGVQVDDDTFEADLNTVEENQPQLPIHMRPINGSDTMIPMNPMVYSMYPRPLRPSAGEIALNDFMDEEADDESEPFEENVDEE